MLLFLLQAAEQAPEVHGFTHKVIAFFDTPLPYSPFTEYFIVLLLLWLLGRREQENKDFAAEAQRVLDQKFQKGEIDRKTYDRYRQELSLQTRKD